VDSHEMMRLLLALVLRGHQSARAAQAQDGGSENDGHENDAPYCTA